MIVSQDAPPAPTLPAYKRCGHCGVDRPLADFHKNRCASTGFHSVCIPCVATGDRVCPVCGTSMSLRRREHAQSHTYCSRECILAGVGLPADFDAIRDLDRATETQVRELLNGVMRAFRP